MGLVVKEGPGEASRDRILDAARDRISREGPDSLPWDESARGFISRCAYFLREIYPGDERLFSVGRLAAEADAWLFPFASFHGGEIFNPESMIKGLEFRLGYDRLRELNKAAPAKIKLPTGSERPLDYSSGDVPVLRVKIQELFGTDVTPAVCGKPVVMELLSPAGRPVQVTRDLAGFWNGSYAEVKKEMAGRYPKHRWPDDPLNEKPSLKTKKQFRERD